MSDVQEQANGSAVMRGIPALSPHFYGEKACFCGD